MDTSSIDLPAEIVELILSKCPFESVVRFKSVSKSWRSIISDPRFARTHDIQRSRLSENQNKFIYMWNEHYCDYLFYFTKWENGNFQTESVLENPFSRKDLLEILSGCDGLFLVGAFNGEYILWNPSIRKHIIIPPFNEPFNHNDMPWLHHLYFDSKTNDYKIVFVYEKCYTVYSCKNGIWGETKDFPGGLFPCPTGVDGCIYSKRNGEIMCWVMEKNGSFEKSWRKLISMEKEEPDLWEPRPFCFTNEGVVVVHGKTIDDEYCDCFKNWIYNPRLNGLQEAELEHFPPDFPYSENLYVPCSNIC